MARNRLLALKCRSFQKPSRLPTLVKRGNPRDHEAGFTPSMYVSCNGPNIRGRTYDDEPNVFYLPTDCLGERPIRCQRALAGALSKRVSWLIEQSITGIL